jgi:hypothetical protein
LSEQALLQLLHQVVETTVMQVHLIQFQALLVVVAVAVVPQTVTQVVLAVVVALTLAQVEQELQARDQMAEQAKTILTMQQAAVAVQAPLVQMERKQDRPLFRLLAVMVALELILIQPGQLQHHLV